MIAGLLFIPTTIFDMIWGVRYLQEAHGFEYADAVLRSAAVPFGWIIGCPLLGERTNSPTMSPSRRWKPGLDSPPTSSLHRSARRFPGVSAEPSR